MNARDSAQEREAAPAPGVTTAGELGASAFVLRDDQLEFFRTLAERSTRLADWYRGAVMTFSDISNPERLPQAAHSIRELMNNLHVLTDVPAEATGDLGSKFATMTEKWETGKRRSGCYADGRWDGVIDSHARAAFGAVDDVIAWHRENRKTRREMFVSVSRSLDVSGQPLPASEEDRRYRAWDELRRYFIKVSKHQRATDDAEFSANLSGFQRFVLDWMRPRVYEEQILLDQLIAEAERGS